MNKNKDHNNTYIEDVICYIEESSTFIKYERKQSTKTTLEQH